MLTYGTIGGLERMCLPVLFKEMSLDLGLNPVSLGLIWGSDALAGVFIGLPGGLLADRFGLKRTLTVVCLIGGLFSALRGFSSGFPMLVFSNFLFGLTSVIVHGIIPKTTAVWFERKQLGFTNALLNISLTGGGMIGTMFAATLLSPLPGGWRNVIFLLSAPAILIGLLWLFTGREPDKSESPSNAISTVPFRQAFSRVIRIREVWAIGLIQITLWGSLMGFSGYLPYYLRDIGWTAVSADSAITVSNAATLAGMIPMVFIANRLRSHKKILILSMVSLGASFAALPFVQGASVFAVLILGGFLRSAAMPLCITLLVQFKGVGTTYSGTAMGLSVSLGMLGPFLASPLGNSFSDISPGAPFLFWAGLALSSLPLFMVIKGETKEKEGFFQPRVET
ncbi:MAG: MFS transporter [Dehalococcoidales bacterium]|nr:MFS transporter [Dehalococcoidales bacterium]